MDRRDSLKTLLIGSVAGAALASGCKTDTVATEETTTSSQVLYGRTPAEIERDEKLMKETFFNAHELGTIAVLCDIILPATATAGSAGEAKVPEFIAFIVKDLTHNQLPMRGGLMWLDAESNSRFNKDFQTATQAEQIQIVDDIAYPDKVPAGMEAGVAFFNRMRNLTLTGYYTTKMGIDDLGYKGNTPNIWDGVPEEVLKQHGVAYEEAWLAKCVDQSKRNEIAEWDADGNLLT